MEKKIKPKWTIDEWKESFEVAYKGGWHGSLETNGLLRDWQRDREILLDKIAKLESGTHE